MTKALWASVFLQCFLLLPMLQAASTEVTLQVVRFPERRDVELTLLPTRRIHRASMKAKVKFEEGQSRIELSYDEMKPAVLFAGDVTCYVLWAVNSRRWCGESGGAVGAPRTRPRLLEVFYWVENLCTDGHGGTLLSGGAAVGADHQLERYQS